MTYLKLIKPNLEKLAETVASALNVEVVIADRNLIRLVGTGSFHSRLDENCAEDSIFAKILQDGQPIVNLYRDDYCAYCSHKESCKEYTNMSHPIISQDQVYGVVSFAAVDQEQAEIMRLKNAEYFNMLEEVCLSIEREIENSRITNKLTKHVVEADEIINCISKGIIIINSDYEILHINLKALEILDLTLSQERIIMTNLKKHIDKVKIPSKDVSEQVAYWKIKGKELRVIYTINKLHLNDGENSYMISFDVLKDIIDLAKTYAGKKNIQFANIIGNSQKLLEAINKSKIAADTDSTILIQGDSGTGKELFARSIHNESQRGSGPFVAINCASIPENLIESELFGYEKGAFTGANVTGKKGLIELASNGTLFLDEIGDLPLHLQTRLLRVLQERSVDKIGSQKPIDVNIRVISASNRDLGEMVKEGKFRLDLYYRLNVIPIMLPSLKERKEDILLSSDFILKDLSQRMNREFKDLSEPVKELFLDYSWPGNIRELENILEHGLCFAKGEEINLEDLPAYIREEVQLKESLPDNIRQIKDYSMKRDSSLEDLKINFERQVIEEMLQQYGHDTQGKKIVAEKLDIGLATLYRKIKDYQVEESSRS